MAVFWILYIISLLLIPVAITKKKKPVTAVAWILAMVFLPILGAILFLIFGTERIVNRGRKKLFSNEELRKHLRSLEAEWAPEDLNDAGEKLPHKLQDIEQLCRRFGLFGAVGKNSVHILVDAEETYKRMAQAIRSAEQSINLEYYIFEPDATGAQFRDLLVEKARQGIRVSLLYDAIGSLKLGWNKTFLDSLHDAGIAAQDFLPLRTFFKPWNINLRNHRKILVVDNKVGFTGSLNVGEQFLDGSQPQQKRWRETHLMVQGPAVTQLQWIFCEDWYFATREELVMSEYFTSHETRGEDVVQIVASGPDAREEAIHKSFMTAINQAEKSIFLTTPYFIPDQSLNLALQLAALRGVDVRILLPRNSDHQFVSLAGRSYYEDLLRNNVRVFEYERGALHAKMLVVDGHYTSIGSANTDVRSFSYNFEINVQIYGESLAKKAEKIFFADLKNSKEIALEEFVKRSAIVRFRENCCRLFSPLL